MVEIAVEGVGVDGETREDVLWHSRNQEYRDQNVMSHPSHGSDWKSFNQHKKVCC